MLISKFDLYKSEWLELVFDDRNKAYGAYDLRQHYAKNMVRAMGITFLGLALLCGASIVLRSNPVAILHPDKPVVVTLTSIVIPKPPVTPPRRTAAPVEPIKPITPIKTQQFTEMVVKPDPQAITPPKITELNNTAIGQTTTNGKPGGDSVLPDQNTGDGTAQPAPDNSVHNIIGLDAMPEPVGGDKAWAKFLNKNLRFPAAAQEDGVSGRVILSFIIEKDGTLSNIVVDRPAGHGFDEEALRVLKLAKAWKPGTQNGQAVRVRFEIPINFQLSDNN